MIVAVFNRDREVDYRELRGKCRDFLAALFIILERVGKAVRSPAKDALLSHATRQVGSGLGFGLHEALDKVGALIGPLLFTLALARAGGYRAGFHWLWLPAVLPVKRLDTRVKRRCCSEAAGREPEICSEGFSGKGSGVPPCTAAGRI